MQEYIKLEFNMSGVMETQRFIKNAGLTEKDVEGGLTDFANYMLGTFKQRFNRETGRSAWVQLAPSTVKAREGKYGSYAAPSSQGSRHKILQWTGELFRSFTQQGAYGNVFNVHGLEMIVGSALKKAGYHAHGGGRLPQRQVAFIDKTNNNKVVSIIHKLLQAKKTGGASGYIPQPPKWIRMGM